MAKLQEHTFLSALAYDAVCVIAMALNRTMNMIDNGDISGTGCEDLEGALVDLDQFSYSNAKMGCLIRYSLENTDFRGISVSERHSYFVLHNLFSCTYRAKCSSVMVHVFKVL